MGQDDPAPELEPHRILDGESPIRKVKVNSFYLDECMVTNAQFKEFIEDTNYLTDANKYNWSFVFQGFMDVGDYKVVVQAPWWLAVPESAWNRPFGPGSSIERLEDHPVVHVSWNDANAYCAWAGKRLPTEAEHERAARGGLEQKLFPWGDEIYNTAAKTEIEKHRCNIWQGNFPEENTREDGFFYTAPAISFEPNAYGLYNMVGNAWEWVSDWWSSTHSPKYQVNPQGPNTGVQKVQRGGSYLCHKSYCYRYRVSARIGNEPDTSTGNLGFRCAKNA